MLCILEFYILCMLYYLVMKVAVDLYDATILASSSIYKYIKYALRIFVHLISALRMQIVRNIELEKLYFIWE